MTVTVLPASASLFLGQSKTFTAAVKNADLTAVNWSVNGVPGGNSALGTIVPASAGADTATYSAPQILPSPKSLTISATSQADASASGSAIIQIQSDVSVSISPKSASIATSVMQAFAATVSGTGSPSIGVSWSVNGISGGNLSVGTILTTAADAASYTAPSTVPSPPAVSVTATSVADPSKFDSVSVTITCAPSSSLSPATASVAISATQVFAASLCVPRGTAIAWDVNGVAGGNSSLGTITPSSTNSSVATYAAPTSIPTTIPVTIHATAVAQSASATVTIVNPTPVVVTVSPASASIPVGQRDTFTATVTGTSNNAVIWTVNSILNGNSTLGQVCAPSSNPCAPPSGSESAVDFLAPLSQQMPSTVTLTAKSVADPTSSGSALITITLPPPVTVSIAPFYTFLDPSQQFQFVATVSSSSNQSVTWSVSSAVPGQGAPARRAARSTAPATVLPPP